MAETIRVGIIADDEWVRRGLYDGLVALGGVIEPTMSVCLDGARRADATELSPIDALLVVAEDDDADWDHIAGIGVAGIVRRRLRDDVQITVITRSIGNPVLPVRAAEEGVDMLVGWDAVRDLTGLESAVLLPDAGRRPGRLADFEALGALGISFNSRPAACLEWIASEHLTAAFIDPTRASLSRRRSITVRSRVSEIAGIRPVESVGGGARTIRTPSWNQVRSFVDLARGAPSDRAHSGSFSS